MKKAIYLTKHRDGQYSIEDVRGATLGAAVRMRGRFYVTLGGVQESFAALTAMRIALQMKGYDVTERNFRRG
jgi:hypothetical protein